MTSKIRIVFTALLALSTLAVGESVTWLQVPDASFYRLSYGTVGGATNVLNVSTNMQTWNDPVRGTTTVSPGASNLVLNVNQRYWLTVQTVISNASVSVISDPSTVVLYTKRPSPGNVLILGE